jgi:hypothetical protein
LLIVSDSISASTGLARIARDLAVRIHANLRDVYDLAVAGYGGVGSCKFGFPQYHFEGVQSDWVLPSLPEIVEDFAGKERCAILFISDPSRLGWFSQPERLGGEALAKFPGLKNWLMTANIEKLIYAPVDASGPNRGVPPTQQDAMQIYMMHRHIFSPYDAEFTQEMPIEEAKKRWPNTPVTGEEKK